jgi:cytochrome c553
MTCSARAASGMTCSARAASGDDWLGRWRATWRRWLRLLAGVVMMAGGGLMISSGSALASDANGARGPDPTEAIGARDVVAASAAEVVALDAHLVAGPPFRGELFCRTGSGSMTHLPPLVADGHCWWTRSPDPDNPVACATCHHDLSLVRGWAVSFPKWKPLPPPHRRVMTLLQASAEAVARHYRVAAAQSAATAITAYLTWLADGLPVTPGISAGQPVFAPRMRQLRRSTARGRAVYAARCAGCHDLALLTLALGRFPRPAGGAGESLESFVEHHRAGSTPLAWDSAMMADLVAYLVSQIAGRPLTGGDSSGAILMLGGAQMAPSHASPTTNCAGGAGARTTVTPTGC